MDITVDTIRKLLGEPTINVELTNEQIQLCIDMAKDQTKNLIVTFKVDDLFDFLLMKLILINCKRLWRTNLTKYALVLPDNDKCKINLNYLIDTQVEEQMIYNLLTKLKFGV